MRSLWVRVRSGRLVTRGGGSYPSVARPHAMPPGPPHGRPANDFRAKAPWASLVGSAVLMLESGVRRRLPDDFRSRWRAARWVCQFFFSRVKPVLSGLPVQSEVFNAAAAR